jgi:hypothetical protein
MIILIAALCLAALCLNGWAAQTNASASAKAPAKLTSTDKFLIRDSGTNLSIMNTTLYSPTIPFGFSGLGVAQAVKFTPPKPGWKLRGAVVYGSDGWNSSQKEDPVQGIFGLEIRDADLNLLYKCADTQLSYFTSQNGIGTAIIEIPAIVTNGDFYICFYGNNIVSTLTEVQNATGNSYYFARNTGQLIPGLIPIPNSNATLPVNWIIRAEGE